MTIPILVLAAALGQTPTGRPGPQNPTDTSASQVRATGASVTRALRDHLRTLPDAEIVASNATTGRRFADRFAEVVNVLDFGADNTGTLDTINAVSTAISKLHDGSTLYFPPGTYRIACGGIGWQAYQLATSGVTLRGDGAIIRPDLDCYFLNLYPNIQRIRIIGFRIVGTLQTDGNAGGININQGKIAINNGSSDIEITGNRWEDCGTAVYFDGVTRLKLHHNELIRTVAGIQGGTPDGGIDVRIDDNHFLGDITNPSTYGSDDQIAVFGPMQHVSISRNFIDKQGQTAKNQARGIAVQVDSGTAKDISILDNELVNVATSTLVAYGPAIELVGNGGTIDGALVRGNTIRNANVGINVSSGSNVTVSGNKLTSIVAVSPGNWGIGIRVADYSYRALIEGNTIDTTDSDGIVVAASAHATVRGNTVKNSGRNAVSASNTTNITVDSNRVDSSTSDPVLLSSTAGAFVALNRLEGTVTTTTPIMDPWTATSVGGGSLSPDASAETTHIYDQYSGASATINAPSNPTTNQRWTVIYRNLTGSPVTVTWNAVFKMAAWGDIAAGYSRSITFRYNGANWVEISRTPTDVPN